MQEGQRGGTDKTTIRPHSRVPIRLTGGAGARETHWSGSGTTRAGCQVAGARRRSRRVGGSWHVGALSPARLFTTAEPDAVRPASSSLRIAGSVGWWCVPAARPEHHRRRASQPPATGPAASAAAGRGYCRTRTCSFLSPSTDSDRARLPPHPPGLLTFRPRRPASLRFIIALRPLGAFVSGSCLPVSFGYLH